MQTDAAPVRDRRGADRLGRLGNGEHVSRRKCHDRRAVLRAFDRFNEVRIDDEFRSVRAMQRDHASKHGERIALRTEGHGFDRRAERRFDAGDVPARGGG